MRQIGILLPAAVILDLVILGLLAGCAANSAKAEYKKHPREFMREVVACESNYQNIGHTTRCRQALRLNASLFNPE